MIGAGGDMRVFWSNGLVGSITTLALILLFWPLIASVFERLQSAFARDSKSLP
jgi:TctA family transporter